MASPNQFLSGDDAVPLINGVQGVAVTQEYVDSLAHHSPDAISWGWSDKYGNFAGGGAAMTCAFSSLPKFLDNAGNTGSKVTGKIGAMLPPGREIDGKLVSRSVLWFSLTGMVSTQSQYPEVAYLLLQWLGFARIYAWMTANSVGYFDAFHLSDFDDPLVRETVARTVPSINFPGATSFHNALDEDLMAALTKAKTAEQAMADTAAEWQKITQRTGEDKIMAAVKASKAAWPTVLDPV